MLVLFFVFLLESVASVTGDLRHDKVVIVFYVSTPINIGAHCAVADWQLDWWRSQRRRREVLLGHDFLTWAKLCVQEDSETFYQG